MTQQRTFKPRPRKNRWQRAADAERPAEPEPRDLTGPGLAAATALLLAKIHETLLLALAIDGGDIAAWAHRSGLAAR